MTRRQIESGDQRGQTEPGLIVSNKRASPNLSFPFTDFSHTGLFVPGSKHRFHLELGLLNAKSVSMGAMFGRTALKGGGVMPGNNPVDGEHSPRDSPCGSGLG